jgi:hypothetical protein
MIKFDVLNRWTGEVQFTAEIDCDESASLRLKMGLSVKWARDSGADLRGAVLSGAVLSSAVLRDADLRGADLSSANLSGADLSGAVLSGAYLRGADLSGAVLSGAYLRGADLRDAVLRGADLRDADLRDAVLRDASNGVPKIERIHQKVFDAARQPEALDMGSWHKTDTCGTTHCRAGWVVSLSGDGGRAMEFCMGTAAAASLIYMASDPKLKKIPDFYCDNKAALDDMKRLAEQEAALQEADNG